MKKIFSLIIMFLLMVGSVFAAVNIGGTIVYPEIPATSHDAVVKESNFISYFINTLSQEALYPSKGTYTTSESIHLQAEIETWNVKCNNVYIRFEIYSPYGGMSASDEKQLGSQTGTKYYSSYVDISRRVVEGTYTAVAYIKCGDLALTFKANNPEYDFSRYPVISTQDVSRTSFIVTSGEECIKTNLKDHTKCYNNNIYWYDNCGGLTSLKEACLMVAGCKDDSTCVEPTPPTPPQPDCSSTEIGKYKCSDNKVYLCNSNVWNAYGFCPTDQICASENTVYSSVTGICKKTEECSPACSSGESCINGKCMPPVCGPNGCTPPTNCTSNSQCSSGQICTNGQCLSTGGGGSGGCPSGCVLSEGMCKCSHGPTVTKKDYTLWYILGIGGIAVYMLFYKKPVKTAQRRKKR